GSGDPNHSPSPTVTVSVCCGPGPTGPTSPSPTAPPPTTQPPSPVTTNPPPPGAAPLAAVTCPSPPPGQLPVSTGTIKRPVNGLVRLDEDNITGTISCLPAGFYAWCTLEITGPPENIEYQYLQKMRLRLWPAPSSVTLLANRQDWQT